VEFVVFDLGQMLAESPEVFKEPFVKYLTKQIVAALEYIHVTAGVVHRDLKPSNLLFSKDGIVKLCDFGLASHFTPLNHKPVIGTRWYRCPEMVLGAQDYGTEIDMWALGCVVAEMFLKRPLFKVPDDVIHLNKMRDILGRPPDNVFAHLPGFPNFGDLIFRAASPPNAPSLKGLLASCMSKAGFVFVLKLLSYNPKSRFTATQAADDFWFKDRAVEILPRAKLPYFDEKKREQYALKKMEKRKKRK
jgi:serine/threonine protein kinase